MHELIWVKMAGIGGIKAKMFAAFPLVGLLAIGGYVMAEATHMDIGKDTGISMELMLLIGGGIWFVAWKLFGLHSAIKESVKTAKESKIAVERNEKHLADLARGLESRPCWMNKPCPDAKFLLAEIQKQNTAESAD